MQIKVCGMRDAANIQAVEALGVNWMGFIFWPKSKRCCQEKPAYLPGMTDADPAQRTKRVGVFVNAEIGEVVEKYLEYKLDAIQLHGDEDRKYVFMLRGAIGALSEEQFHPYQLIKAVSLKKAQDIEAKCESLVGFVDYFLFDTPSAGYGGTGTTFDWKLLEQYKYMTPFFLSGGIGLETLPAVKAFEHPCCQGFDLNSRFETAPGLKDVSKLREFLVALQ